MSKTDTKILTHAELVQRNYSAVVALHVSCAEQLKKKQTALIKEVN